MSGPPPPPPSQPNHRVLQVVKEERLELSGGGRGDCKALWRGEEIARSSLLVHTGSSIVPLHSVSAQEPAIIRQLLPLANCATTQIQIHLPKHANTGTQTHRQVKGPTGNLQYFQTNF